MNRRSFLSFGAGVLSAGLLPGCAATEDVSDGASSFAQARRFASTRHGDIAYVQRGRGPAALFLHGFPLNGYQWRDALLRLAPFRRCVAPDFMGLGHTRVASGQDVGPDAQVEMLIALLDALGIGTVDLVANDSGGAVAQLLVARHAARVRTLLLTNCDTERESPPAAMLPVIELAKQGRFADEWLAPWLADPVLARSERGIGGLCYTNPAHPTDEALREYFAPLLASAASRAALHAYAAALERNPLTGIGKVLSSSRVPARIVWGMQDSIFSPDNADFLAGSFGRSRGVRRLEGARLFWPEERPDVIAAQARILWESARTS